MLSESQAEVIESGRKWTMGAKESGESAQAHMRVWNRGESARIRCAAHRWTQHSRQYLLRSSAIRYGSTSVTHSIISVTPLQGQPSMVQVTHSNCCVGAADRWFHHTLLAMHSPAALRISLSGQLGV